MVRFVCLGKAYYREKRRPEFDGRRPAMSLVNLNVMYGHLEGAG